MRCATWVESVAPAVYHSRPANMRCIGTTNCFQRAASQPASQGAAARRYRRARRQGTCGRWSVIAVRHHAGLDWCLGKPGKSVLGLAREHCAWGDEARKARHVKGPRPVDAGMYLRRPAVRHGNATFRTVRCIYVRHIIEEHRQQGAVHFICCSRSDWSFVVQYQVYKVN